MCRSIFHIYVKFKLVCFFGKQANSVNRWNLNKRGTIYTIKKILLIMGLSFCVPISKHASEVNHLKEEKLHKKCHVKNTMTWEGPVTIWPQLLLYLKLLVSITTTGGFWVLVRGIANGGCWVVIHMMEYPPACQVINIAQYLVTTYSALAGTHVQFRLRKQD